MIQPESGKQETDCFDRELERIAKVVGEPNRGFWKECLQRYAKFDKAKRKFKAIRNGDDHQVSSTLAEINYALFFAGLGYAIDIEPVSKGHTGPDLKVGRDSTDLFVEVKYFRDINSKPPPILGVDQPLEVYGNPQKDQQMIRDRIVEKFPQLRRGTSMLAFWSDKDSMGDLEFECAVRQIRDEASGGVITVPTSLLFVCYVSQQWIAARSLQQFFCFPVARTINEPFRTWMGELQASWPDNLIRRAMTQG